MACTSSLVLASEDGHAEVDYGCRCGQSIDAPSSSQFSTYIPISETAIGDSAYQQCVPSLEQKRVVQVSLRTVLYYARYQ